jgi:hypothetical protein
MIGIQGTNVNSRSCDDQRGNCTGGHGIHVKIIGPVLLTVLTNRQCIAVCHIRTILVVGREASEYNVFEVGRGHRYLFDVFFYEGRIVTFSSDPVRGSVIKYP